MVRLLEALSPCTVVSVVTHSGGGLARFDSAVILPADVRVCHTIRAAKWLLVFTLGVVGGLIDESHHWSSSLVSASRFLVHQQM